MADYQAFHCIETGFSHLKTRCEDYAGSFSDGTLHIAAISDGHGEKACLRSYVGSRYAVQIALEKMQGFARALEEEGWTDRLAVRKDRERLLRQLIRSIIGNWNIAVLQELQDNPLTQEEWEVPHRYADAYRQGKDLTHIYGCTLIAAMVLGKYLIVLHHGDGRCVVLHADGTCDQPVPWDPLCVGNVTTSLCHEDAVERCRNYVCDLEQDPVVACYVTSDGIEDSYENLPDQNGLNAFFCNLTARLVREGREAVQEAMKTELPRISQYGSHDDTSFGAIVDLSVAEPMAEQLELVYQLYLCNAEDARLRAKLNSMQRKRAYLREELEKAEYALEESSTTAQNSADRIRWLQSQLQLLTSTQEDVRKRNQLAQERLQKARSEYDSYEEAHAVYARRNQENQSLLAELQEKMRMLMERAQEETAQETTGQEELQTDEAAAAGNASEAPEFSPAEEIFPEEMRSAAEEAPAEENPPEELLSAEEEVPAEEETPTEEEVPVEEEIPPEETLENQFHQLRGEDLFR